MTLKELKFFYLLSNNPNISEIAKELNITQSAISLAIKSLEKKLGEKLFDRIGKKLILNERGRFFKEKTYNHYLALLDAKSIFLKDKLSGELKVASSKTIGNYILAQKIFDFLLNYNVKIENKITNSNKIIKMVLDGKIDIGFIETKCNEEDIIKEKFGSDNLVVVTSDKSLLKKEYFIDELLDKIWLLREKGSGTREVFLNEIGDIFNELNYFLYSDFAEVKQILLKNNNTITCISQYAIEDEIKDKKLFKIKLKNISFQRNLYIIYHKNKFKSKLFTNFIEFIKN